VRAKEFLLLLCVLACFSEVSRVDTSCVCHASRLMCFSLSLPMTLCVSVCVSPALCMCLAPCICYVRLYVSRSPRLFLSSPLLSAKKRALLHTRSCYVFFATRREHRC
jgi:hypothetical protein